MSSIKVAVRARPLNDNELPENKNIKINEKCIEIINPKLVVTHQDKVKQFYFDFCYSNVDQETIYNDIGNDIVQLAHEGFNACIFAYGQTGSGKTFTMIGSPANKGLIHRICENLTLVNLCQDINIQSNISYMEIYNEKVQDLIVPSNKKILKIRENPISGPYVEGLSKHVIRRYRDFEELLIRGNLNRSVASTKMNQHSSRSHAIITIYFTQAKITQTIPSEIVSKIHLVDLAGSEKSDIANTIGDRLKEGSCINKSLTMLACVISALAQTSDTKKNNFIPYRNSTLTWLLKDSLGGNSKTVMIATISPVNNCYSESLSTLRYASQAKRIFNKPVINEDPNVKLIRELKEENFRLRQLLEEKLMPENLSVSFNEDETRQQLFMNEEFVNELFESWKIKWIQTSTAVNDNTKLYNKSKILNLSFEMPCLICIHQDSYYAGLKIIYLKEGINYFDKEGSILKPESDATDAVMRIDLHKGCCTLQPLIGKSCMLDGQIITCSQTLIHGSIVQVDSYYYYYNIPQFTNNISKSYNSIDFNFEDVYINSRNSNLCNSSLSIADSAIDCDKELNLSDDDHIHSLKDKFKNKSFTNVHSDMVCNMTSRSVAENQNIFIQNNMETNFLNSTPDATTFFNKNQDFHSYLQKNSKDISKFGIPKILRRKKLLNRKVRSSSLPDQLIISQSDDEELLRQLGIKKISFEKDQSTTKSNSKTFIEECEQDKDNVFLCDQLDDLRIPNDIDNQLSIKENLENLSKKVLFTCEAVCHYVILQFNPCKLASNSHSTSLNYKQLSRRLEICLKQLDAFRLLSHDTCICKIMNSRLQTATKILSLQQALLWLTKDLCNDNKRSKNNNLIYNEGFYKKQLTLYETSLRMDCILKDINNLTLKYPTSIDSNLFFQNSYGVNLISNSLETDTEFNNLHYASKINDGVNSLEMVFNDKFLKNNSDICLVRQLSTESNLSSCSNNSTQQLCSSSDWQRFSYLSNNAISNLKTELTVLRETLLHKLGLEWNELFNWTIVMPSIYIEDIHLSNKAINLKNIDRVDEGNEIQYETNSVLLTHSKTIYNICDLLKTLKHRNMLTCKLNTLANDIYDNFICNLKRYEILVSENKIWISPIDTVNKIQCNCINNSLILIIKNILKIFLKLDAIFSLDFVHEKSLQSEVLHCLGKNLFPKCIVLIKEQFSLTDFDSDWLTVCNVLSALETLEIFLSNKGFIQEKTFNLCKLIFSQNLNNILSLKHDTITQYYENMLHNSCIDNDFFMNLKSIRVNKDSPFGNFSKNTFKILTDVDRLKYTEINFESFKKHSKFQNNNIICDILFNIEFKSNIENIVEYASESYMKINNLITNRNLPNCCISNMMLKMVLKLYGICKSMQSNSGIIKEFYLSLILDILLLVIDYYGKIKSCLLETNEFACHLGLMHNDILYLAHHLFIFSTLTANQLQTNYVCNYNQCCSKNFNKTISCSKRFYPLTDNCNNHSYENYQNIRNDFNIDNLGISNSEMGDNLNILELDSLNFVNMFDEYRIKFKDYEKNLRLFASDVLSRDLSVLSGRLRRILLPLNHFFCLSNISTSLIYDTINQLFSTLIHLSHLFTNILSSKLCARSIGFIIGEILGMMMDDILSISNFNLDDYIILKNILITFKKYIFVLFLEKEICLNEFSLEQNISSNESNIIVCQNDININDISKLNNIDNNDIQTIEYVKIDELKPRSNRIESISSGSSGDYFDAIDNSNVYIKENADILNQSNNVNQSEQFYFNNDISCSNHVDFNYYKYVNNQDESCAFDNYFNCFDLDNYLFSKTNFIADNLSVYFENAYKNMSKLSETNTHKCLADNVSVWIKFVEFLRLFESSVEEIGDRWAAGKGPLALYFDGGSIGDLIIAIFENTAKVRTIVEEIKLNPSLYL